MQKHFKANSAGTLITTLLVCGILFAAGRAAALEWCGTIICISPTKCCSYQCLNVLTDETNCGDCGVQCDPGEVCLDGQCNCDGVACGPGERCCNGVCINILTNRNNCGSCGNICSGAESCSAGVCRCFFDVCSADEFCCPDDGCTNRNTDPRNCGLCGSLCGQGEGCEDGLCRCGTATASFGSDTCPDAYACCGSPAACAPSLQCACGTVQCAEGQVCCGPTIDLAPGCVYLKTDPRNCGACGVACGPGEFCQNGFCTLNCQSGLANCSGSCVNLATDRENCGVCGNTCASGEICDGAGSCDLSCEIGYAECEDRCVDLSRDRDHCGTCGNTCAPGEICDGAGACVSECASLADDLQNCESDLSDCLGDPTTTTTAEPTLIELSGIEASPLDKAVQLRWLTESETDCAGFNVWRAEGFRQINEGIIPALGSPAGGAEYDFLDEGLLNGRRYFYLLEDKDTEGISTFHGPVKTVPRKR
ncbi:hypothetical protein ACFL43_03355 [Thermodesulfobacteriota bacterium]